MGISLLKGEEADKFPRRNAEEGLTAAMGIESGYDVLTANPVGKVFPFRTSIFQNYLDRWLMTRHEAKRKTLMGGHPVIFNRATQIGSIQNEGLRRALPLIAKG